MPNFAYINNKFVNFKSAKIHIEDRGLQFADSVYEVIAVLDNNLIGIVTTRTGIGSDLDRVMFDTTTGIGNTHNFTTTRNIVTGTLRIIDVQATTVGVHSMRPTNTLEMTLVSTARSTVTATYDTGTRFVSIGSSVNPPLRLTVGDTLIVNTDDGSMFCLLYTSPSPRD